MPPDPPALTPSAASIEVLLAKVGDSQATPAARIVCPGVLVAGRSLTSHLVLPATDLSASKLHFLIELRPTHCVLTNHSDQGTFVNGMLVRGQCELRHGDLIRAGLSVFQVELCRQGEPMDLPPYVTMAWQPPGETTTPPEELPLPTPLPATIVQLPGYRLLSPLGKGGMGTVWLAEDRTGQRVACKLIRPDKALDSDSCARFRRETNHLRDLRHPFVVGFREAGEHHGILYLVMDYVPGNNLAELLKRQGVFAVGRAVRLLCQVLEALAEAHNNGIVHRDVKPSNILVHNTSSGEESRLADFGLAKAYQTADVDNVTLPGVMGGTLPFASPEMISDFRRAGPLADQYGAAATLYNLLSGRYLHDVNNALDMLDCIRSRDPVPLGQCRADIPEELGRVIHRALSREARLRYPTAQALSAALSPFAD